MPDHPLDEELALTERVGRELARRGLTNQAGHLREYWVALKAGRVSKVWSHDLSVEWLRALRLSPHESDYPVLPRMSDCPGCTVSQKFTAMNFPGGAKFKCGACKSEWLELDPCRFALDRRFTRLDAPALRDAICVSTADARTSVTPAPTTRSTTTRSRWRSSKGRPRPRRRRDRGSESPSSRLRHRRATEDRVVVRAVGRGRHLRRAAAARGEAHRAGAERGREEAIVRPEDLLVRVCESEEELGLLRIAVVVAVVAHEREG